MTLQKASLSFWKVTYELVCVPRYTYYIKRPKKRFYVSAAFLKSWYKKKSTKCYWRKSQQQVRNILAKNDKQSTHVFYTDNFYILLNIFF